MQHGENGAALPRQLSNILARVVRDGHNSDRHIRRWKGSETTLFRVAEADMSKVQVTVVRNRRRSP